MCMASVRSRLIVIVIIIIIIYIYIFIYYFLFIIYIYIYIYTYLLPWGAASYSLDLWVDIDLYGKFPLQVYIYSHHSLVVGPLY